MNNKSNKTYVDGIWLRERKFNDGGSLLNVSILVTKFADFVKKYKKNDGFINLVIAARKEPDEKNTHYAYLDTWEPNTSKSSNTKQKTSKLNSNEQKDSDVEF